MTENQKMEKLQAALDWYAEQAMKINAYARVIDGRGMMAVMQEMAIDNGQRAREAAKE